METPPHKRRLSSGNHRLEGWSDQSNGQTSPRSGTSTPTTGGGGSLTPRRSELEFALLKQQVNNLSQKLDKYIDTNEARRLKELTQELEKERCCSLF